jgi:hypothetical protein
VSTNEIQTTAEGEEMNTNILTAHAFQTKVSIPYWPWIDIALILLFVGGFIWNQTKKKK